MSKKHLSRQTRKQLIVHPQTQAPSASPQCPSPPVTCHYIPEKRKIDWIAIILAIANVALVAVTGFLVYYAKDQSHDMKETIRISEESLVAGKRAFVSVVIRPETEVTLSMAQKSESISGRYFTVIWKNSGETPTRNMIAHSSKLSIKPALNLTDFAEFKDFPDVWATGDKVEATPLGIAPKESSIGVTLKFTTEEINDVISGKRSAFLWGWCTYNDIFPDTKLHVTRFAFRLQATGIAQDREKISFNFDLLTRYNCCDEECDSQGYSAELFHPTNIFFPKEGVGYDAELINNP